MDRNSFAIHHGFQVDAEIAQTSIEEKLFSIFANLERHASVSRAA